MNNFSKIIILILLVLSFFFIREKTGFKIPDVSSLFKNMPKVEIPDKEKEEVVKQPTEKIVKEPAEKEKVSVYFLALDSNGNGIYKKVQRELPTKEERLEFAIKELLKGPNLVEKSMGAYSEIPSSTKIRKIKQTGNKIVLDFTSDFQYGGGTDSIYSRMMQLIKTSVDNTKNKQIYLYLDGKQVNTIGGEGIMITQPLNEKSLEI